MYNIVSCSQCQSTSTCYQYQHDDKTVLVGEKRLLRTGICFIKAQIHRRQFISVSKFQYSQMIIVKWYPMSDNLQVQCACRKVTMKRGIYIPEHCKQFRNLDSTPRIEMMSSLQKISKQADEIIYHLLTNTSLSCHNANNKTIQWKAFNLSHDLLMLSSPI